MSKIITHEANGAVHVLVEDEDMRKFSGFKISNTGHLCGWFAEIKRWVVLLEDPLPPGQYEIIGVADQLTEVWCIIARSHSLTPSTCLVLRKKP